VISLNGSMSQRPPDRVPTC